ncbi:2-keto-4-pentenoate hydratase [Pseudomonas sp. GOM7]|uniref:2-keto-4-pentenoate hydratase n=1 Tax=unclassified Pseudomonas TaxID=196821 RepID=UPI00227C2ADD|nr:MULTISPECIES: 2-keto-4-pentenoate hydratase [unclassified Pseudomonas]WAJ38774.1 2-keto-4-pentenoate hydratase [Pseudomonas sp. GOM7]
MSGLSELPAALRQALQQAQPLPRLEQAVSLVEGYRLQGEALAQAGVALGGWKVALSGAPAQARLGLSEPVYGWLSADMQRAPGSLLPLARLIAPKLEVEVAFELGRDIAPGEHDDVSLLAAVSRMAPAFEIADCRWQGWRFDAGAFLADDAAAGLYCLGPWQRFDAQACRRIECRLMHDDAVLGSAEAGEIPEQNLLWLLRRLLADGQPLRAGQVILSGALLAPLDIQMGEYRVRMMGVELALGFGQANQEGA